MSHDGPQNESVLVISLEEPLDARRLEAHQIEIDSWISMGGSRVVVGLGALHFINSAGLGFMIRMRRKLKEQGGRLVLSNPGDVIKKALRILDLGDLFHVYESDEEAMRVLQG